VTLREPKQKAPAETAAPWENPLVPHLVLRQMYEKMLQSRLLEEHLSTAPKKKTGKVKSSKRTTESTREQEACRVAVVQGLVEGDLVAEAHPGPAMAFLLGAELRQVLNGSVGNAPGPLLPFIESARGRLHAALGAAMALRSMKSQGTVVAYVKHSEANDKVWKDVLRIASQQVLPMIFVVLPQLAKRGKTSDRAEVSKLARSCQVPGIAVDASDAIALYRVAQESLGRVRGGGGPVLIECVHYRLQGGQKGDIPDPLAEMKKHLLDRGAAQNIWIEQVGDLFHGILQRSQREADRQVAR
jgi:acetoin:2,6-dichlorophenolindophenol oxidoreductase subunit alpha